MPPSLGWDRAKAPGSLGLAGTKIGDDKKVRRAAGAVRERLLLGERKPPSCARVVLRKLQLRRRLCSAPAASARCCQSISTCAAIS